MFDRPHELQSKYDEFCELYDWSVVWLANAGCRADELRHRAWAATLIRMPLTEAEEDLFRRWMAEEDPHLNKGGSTESAGPIPKPDSFVR